MLQFVDMLAALTACAFGFVSGLRHALEPDHLAAVSTLVAGQKNAFTTVRYAAAWGAGHGVMLVALGGALALFRTELPALASDAFELVVAIALIALGVRGLLQARHESSGLSASGTPVAHRHGARGHVHAARASDHVHVGRWSLARLPFAIGLIHGLAGSGALAALIAARVPSAAFALSFIAIYAFGAAVGMSALAGVLGWPLARVTRSARALPILVGTSAMASLGIGLWWAWLSLASLA